MSCELAHSTVHGYFDGELDAVRAAEFESHLDICGECQASLGYAETLRRRLQRPELYERASPQFREQIDKQFGYVTRTGGSSARSGRRTLLLPALAVLAVAVGFAIAWYLIQPGMGTAQITAELIDAHVRSLEPGHLTDVQSTDQHTVKPWFDGKLDFIPPVSDYSGQGFPLIGGRLDIIDGHSVAAVVYGRRKHIIDLFVWPTRGTAHLTDQSGSRQGYNWIMWRSEDMQFCLVSDVSAADLRQFKNLIHP